MFGCFDWILCYCTHLLNDGWARTRNLFTCFNLRRTIQVWIIEHETQKCQKSNKKKLKKLAKRRSLIEFVVQIRFVVLILTQPVSFKFSYLSLFALNKAVKHSFQIRTYLLVIKNSRHHWGRKRSIQKYTNDIVYKDNPLGLVTAKTRTQGVLLSFLALFEIHRHSLQNDSSFDSSNRRNQ